MASKKRQPSGKKVEARLNKTIEAALALYMSDHHLENVSEVLKSSLGYFLEKEGYLSKITDGENAGQYKVTTPDEWLALHNISGAGDLEDVARVALNVKE